MNKEHRCYVTHLECSRCRAQWDHRQLHNLCTCGKPLLVRYDLRSIAGSVRKEHLRDRDRSIWRYQEFLPVERPENIVTLGEGYTPILPAVALGSRLGMKALFIKDEGQLPTGSFKARGLAMAVSKAKELGVRRAAIPSAGNAAGALAAYGARGGIEVFIFMPQDTPEINKKESILTGAHVYLIDGLINDCGRIVGEGKKRIGWFDVSTLKEPYRIEGKKTMGLELAEQFGWDLPDWIIYPTGGGTGLIGMWKAFEELEAIGWIGGRRPRMVAVQAEGCAPIVKAFHEGATEAPLFPNARTLASGMRVPIAIGDFIMLDILRRSAGSGITVTDEEIMDAMARIARLEGLVASPEGAATLAAVEKLRAAGRIGSEDRVLCFNTGAGQKYPETIPGDCPLLSLKSPGDLERFFAQLV
jgi:threonine synthase